MHTEFVRALVSWWSQQIAEVAALGLGNRSTSPVPSAQNQLSRKRKGCKHNHSHTNFFYQKKKKKKAFLMMIHVFDRAFHCLVLSAVTCATSVGYIFVNSPYCCLAGTPVYPNRVYQNSVTDWQLPADGKPGLMPQSSLISLLMSEYQILILTWC